MCIVLLTPVKKLSRRALYEPSTSFAMGHESVDPCDTLIEASNSSET